ncbi:MAG: threonine synthase, partial [Candidatus Tectomicrobia bacterium]|nr:threonine synthase [Candidatus Tectomicrobia bacterium]
MEYNCWLECINPACGATYSIFDSIYRCRECSGLLEVTHDLEGLRARSASEWRHLFDDRYKRNTFPYGSGVWGKKEWVCPLIEDDNIISFYEGGTNLFRAGRLGQELGLGELWIKQCGNSHTGSFKDLGMTVLVSAAQQMVADGRRVRALACASTGDTSASLAAYCASAGLPAIVFLPREKVSLAQLIQPIAHGAVVLSIDTDFDGCMRFVQKVCEEQGIYLANSVNSLRIEGQKTISVELVQQFDWEVPDLILIPGGNLGNVSALGKGFLMMRDLGLIDRLPRIVCAQAERANPLYRSFLTGFREYKPIEARPTLATAIQIGNPVSIQRAIRTLKTFEGSVEHATEEELANAAARGDRTGMYNCPQTGVALAALEELAARGEVGPNDRVVVISTAHGLKFTEFKIQYHHRRIEGTDCRFANQPIELPNDLGAVQEAVEQHLAS